MASLGLTICKKSYALGDIMEEVMAIPKMYRSEAIVSVRVGICKYIYGKRQLGCWEFVTKFPKP